MAGGAHEQRAHLTVDARRDGIEIDESMAAALAHGADRTVHRTHEFGALRARHVDVAPLASVVADLRDVLQRGEWRGDHDDRRNPAHYFEEVLVTIHRFG